MQIPKNLPHAICYPHIFLSKNQAKDLTDQSKAKTILLKYFPKLLIHNVPFSPDTLLQNRVKSIKLIQKMPCKPRQKSLWSLSTTNKRKTLQSPLHFEEGEVAGTFSKHSYKLLRILPNIERINLSASEETDWDGPKPDDKPARIPRIANYLNGMINLKHLSLSTSPQLLLPTLLKLNSNEKMLRKLHVFEISWISSETDDFLKTLLKCKNILKNLTSLKLDSSGGKETFEVLQLLPNNCHRLSSLSFLAFDISPQDSNSFENLFENLESLKKLSISTRGFPNFFRYVRLPASLSDLNLHFHYVHWEKLMDPTSERFEDISVFNDKHRNMLNLKRFSINFYGYEPRLEKSTIQPFLNSFLESISTLKELKIFLEPSQLMKDKTIPTFDLSFLFNSLKHLNQSLETLIIHNFDHCSLFFVDDNQIPDFPKLSHFTLHGRIEPSKTLDHLLELKLSGSERSPPFIRPGEIPVNSNESFLELLCKLDKMKDLKGKRIEIVIIHQNQAGDDKYFEENYERVKNEIRGLKHVSLEIKLCIRPISFRFKKELQSLESCFENLKIRYWVPHY